MVNDGCEVGGTIEANLRQGLAVGIYNALDACRERGEKTESHCKIPDFAKIG